MNEKLAKRLNKRDTNFMLAKMLQLDIIRECYKQGIISKKKYKKFLRRISKDRDILRIINQYQYKDHSTNRNNYGSWS